MIRNAILSVMLPLLFTSLAGAQEWAVKMFSATEHNFGSVAHGAKAEFPFVIKNIYKEDVHIASVRSSCGCTTPSISKRDLKTHETTEILATYNTRAFLGEKGATITVIFDKPYYAEVQLNVSGYIRDDVAFEPGEINFGEVEQASTAMRQVKIRHEGRSDWSIVDVTSPNRSFAVELSEPVRRGAAVTYLMTVRLKEDAKPGYFQDRLTIVSNDRQAQRIRLFTQGRVVSPLTVSPASLYVGNLVAGASVTKQLVVRGKQPFTITAIACEDERFDFADPPAEKKTLHFVPVTFACNGKMGKFSESIQIETDLGIAAACLATGTISAAPQESR